ncbi:MAG: hypothetical protein HGA45_41380, partial [Chloroflexales bacterium]|nr:hypothetical protein [Chloroflexales bacterium]
MSNEAPSESLPAQLSLLSDELILEESPQDAQGSAVTAAGWPATDRFPHNRPSRYGVRRTVGDVLGADLAAARQVLIITGFSSLDQLVRFLASCERPGEAGMRPKERIRILLGHEPLAAPYRPRPAAGTTVFADDIRDYWLSRGISLQQCHDVVLALEALQRDTVEVRISSEAHHPVHAKIYVTESVVVAGSSNFSNAGLRTQLEHNWRISRGQRGSASLAEPQAAIAEQFWSMGKPFTEDLSKLLMDLLHEVSWQEALARGCAEILEGKWARRYLASLALGEASVLWPYQVEGVAQALYLAQKVGGVLVADATGSGKTRQGAALIKALLQRMWAQSGRLRNDMPVVLCPPKVVGDWKDHAATCGVALTIFSHGAMSRTTSDEFARVSAAVRRAQILAIDEAHNFLNR